MNKHAAKAPFAAKADRTAALEWAIQSNIDLFLAAPACSSYITGEIPPIIGG
jgi:hypothetical protein